MYFHRNATMSGAKRRGQPGCDRRPNAAWVSSPAVWPGCIARRAPTGRTGPRGFCHRLLSPHRGRRCQSTGRPGDEGHRNQRRKAGADAGRAVSGSVCGERWRCRTRASGLGPRRCCSSLAPQAGSGSCAGSLWWDPGERREREAQFSRWGGGSGGMHRRSSPHRENWAARVSPPAARPRPTIPPLRAALRVHDIFVR